MLADKVEETTIRTMTILDKVKNNAVDAGFNLGKALVIFVIGIYLIEFLLRIVKKGRLFKRMDPTASSFVYSFLKVTAYIILFITVATIIGVPLTSMITLIGSCGVAIGLALQGGLSNIAGGLIILIFKPFKVGDFVDTHADSGTVKDISIFYTTLITPDNRAITIPNGELANKPIVNYSKEKERRLDIDVNLAYESDKDKTMYEIREIVNKEDAVLKDKDIFIKITDYKDSSITYTIRVWVKSSDYWDTKFRILDQIKEKLQDNKLNIPYNQIDVNIKK